MRSSVNKMSKEESVFVVRFYDPKTGELLSTGVASPERIFKAKRGRPKAIEARKIRIRPTALAKELPNVNPKNPIERDHARSILEDQKLGRVWGVVYDPYESVNNAKADERRMHLRGIMTNVLQKFMATGELNAKQHAFLETLMRQYDDALVDIQAQEIEANAAKDIPAELTYERVTVEGRIMSIKGHQSHFGYVTKCLVQHVDGWKIWGKLPIEVSDAKVGDVIRFDARIEVAKDDKKFGYFSRPSKAKVIEAMEVIPEVTTKEHLAAAIF